MSITDQIVQAESGGDPNARNPNSSASGPGQFVDSTFLDVARKMRPELADRPDSEVLALKTDPQFSRQATDFYAQQNQAILQKNGLPVTPGNTYLSHFAGPGGAVKILQADPNAPVEGILSKQAIDANPFLKGMTAQGLQAWAAKKVGVQAPQPGNAPQTPASPPAGPPMQLAPQLPQGQPQQPIFAQAPQQQGTPIQPVPDTAPIQPAQIQYARPRPIDLSALRAAFPSPIFAKG